jgi:hypothetical protein
MKLISGFPTGIWGVLGLLILMAFFSFAGGAWAATPTGAELKKLTANIHWLGHDSFRIDGEGAVIYLDPTSSRKGRRPT